MCREIVSTRGPVGLKVVTKEFETLFHIMIRYFMSVRDNFYIIIGLGHRGFTL